MIEEKKYLGWHLESFSIEHDFFTLNLMRGSFGSGAEMERAMGSARAKLIFISPKRVAFSQVQNGAEVAHIEYRGTQSGTEYTLSFVPDSSILISAADSRDLIF